MGYIFTTIKRIENKLKADAPKIITEVKTALDSIEEKLGEELIADATSSTSKEVKTTAIESVLATFGSSLLTSATGSTVTITSAEVEPIASGLVNILDSIETKIGSKLEA